MSNNVLIPKRRQLIKGLAATSALAMGGGLMSKSFAADKKVVVGTWGGDYERFLREGIEPLVPNLEVLYNVGSAVQRKTRVLAEKDARRVSMDVAMLSDFDMYTCYDGGGLLDVADLDIPNMSNVYEQFEFPYAVPHIFSAMVIVYNKDIVKTAPDSFSIALDPEYKGKVGFSDLLYYFNTLFAGLANGGSGKSFDNGIEFLKQLKDNQPKVFPSNEAVASAFKSGEIVISCMWKARAEQWRASGLPLAFAVPKEGLLPFNSMAGAVRKIKDKKAVAEYLNALLEPKAQRFFSEHMGYAPTVKNADLSPDLMERVGFTDKELDRMAHYDMPTLLATMSDCLDFWNKEFKPGL